MRWLHYLFISFFIIAHLAGEQIEYEPQEVATNEGLPSSIVNGCVCVITGEYIDVTNDLVIPGPESFELLAAMAATPPRRLLAEAGHSTIKIRSAFRKL